MTTLSLVFLYGGVFVVGGLGFVVALILTSKPLQLDLSEREPASPDDAVDPIRSLSF